jgi:hypothetical protein
MLDFSSSAKVSVSFVDGGTDRPIYAVTGDAAIEAINRITAANSVDAIAEKLNNLTWDLIDTPEQFTLVIYI